MEIFIPININQVPSSAKNKYSHITTNNPFYQINKPKSQTKRKTCKDKLDEGNTTKNNSTLKSNNSMTNVDSTVSRDNTSQEECKKINYDGKIENVGNNKIGTANIAETKNLLEKNTTNE